MAQTGTFDATFLRAESALAAIRVPIPGAARAEQAAFEFRETCLTLEGLGPSVIVRLRAAASDAAPQAFSKAQTATRLLAQLAFPDAARVLIDLAVSPDPVRANLAWQALRYLPASEQNFRLLREAFAAPAGDPLERERREMLVDPLGRQLLPPFYRAAAGWVVDHPSNYVRRSLALALVAAGVPETIPLLHRALADTDAVVRIRARVGLVLSGERQFIDEVAGLAASGTVESRYEAITWLGLLPLPEVVGPLRASLGGASGKALLASLAGVHNVGLPESLLDLAAFLDNSNTRVAEQSADLVARLAGTPLPFEWKGRRLTSKSVAAVRRLCENVRNARIGDRRYRGGRLLSPGDLVDALAGDQSRAAFWILAGMTGERFDFDPDADLPGNQASIQRWRDWCRNHAARYEDGRWYYRGALQSEGA